MTPYYEQDGITIYHGDCRDVLPTLEPVDVLLTDPPYGIGLVTKTSDFRGSDRFDNGASLQASTLYDDDPDAIRALIADVIPAALSLSKRGMVFCGPAMLWAYPEPRAVGCVFNANGAGRSPWGFQCMHPVLYYGKDPFLEDGKGGRPNSLKDEQPNREKIDHPCPKPIHWMRWAVARSSREGETILDPFAGSGTTLVASKALGRKAIGIEREERYCDLAIRRLQQSVMVFA
jgi:site-specific DNA-methyltransferase (adenine-specific)